LAWWIAHNGGLSEDECETIVKGGPADAAYGGYSPAAAWCAGADTFDRVILPEVAKKEPADWVRPAVARVVATNRHLSQTESVALRLYEKGFAHEHFGRMPIPENVWILLGLGNEGRTQIIDTLRWLHLDVNGSSSDFFPPSYMRTRSYKALGMEGLSQFFRRVLELTDGNRRITLPPYQAVARWADSVREEAIRSLNEMATSSVRASPVDYVYALLQMSSPNVRPFIAGALLNDDKAVPVGTKLAGSTEAWQRALAPSLIAKAPLPEARPILLKLARDRDQGVTMEAKRVLGALGVKDNTGSEKAGTGRKLPPRKRKR